MQVLVSMTLSKFQKRILEICSRPKTPKQIFKELLKVRPYSYTYLSNTIMVLKDRGLLKRINGKGVVYVSEKSSGS